MTVMTDQRDWDLFVQSLIYAYNDREQCTAGTTHLAWFFAVSDPDLPHSSHQIHFRLTKNLRQHQKFSATDIYPVHPEFSTALRSE